MGNLRMALMALLMLPFLSACNKEQTETLIIDDITITAEGPLFEGPNTAQGEVSGKLKAFADEHHITMESIHSAVLKKMTLSVADTASFDWISSISVQVASEKSDMVEVATINNIKAGSHALDLTVATEKNDLLPTLRQDKFTLVADANMNKDMDGNMVMKGKMEIEIKY